MNSENYIKTLNYVNKFINKTPINSFKKLGNNPESLTKFKYISDVSTTIHQYMITDKADGLRTFLLINNERDTNYINGKEMKYIPNTELNIQPQEKYILDCELVEQNSGKKVFYVFDIILYQGKNISFKPFNERFKMLQDIKNNLLKSTDIIQIKIFYPLSLKTYQTNIMKLWKGIKNKPYKTDGIIFTKTDQNYKRTKNYKWKPIKQLTIDFLCLKYRNSYYLLNGIHAQMFKQNGYDKTEEYKNVIKTTNLILNENYFPLFFNPSFSPRKDIHLYKNPPENKEIHDKIIELSYDTSKNNWIFHKIRTDREQELKEGTYYGNNFRVAELNFQSIVNPLYLKDLVKPLEYLTKDFYFEKQDDTYLGVRKLNSFVKRNLIHKYPLIGKTIIDLGSGKGQNLPDYYKAEVKNILLLEYDINAIDEIINRKYNIKNKSNSFLKVFQMDLNQSYMKNINTISNITSVELFKMNSVPVIFSHFAFHYLCDTQKNAENIISFINYYLNKGGEFVFTALNGEKVYKLLKQNNGKWEVKIGDKIKYSIKLKSKQSEFKPFKNIIEVLLPCSNKPYTETLIDLYAMDKLFKKHNIIRVENKTHNNFINEFSVKKPQFYKLLNENNKIFIGL